jgi:Trypsin-like peptidase domain
MPTQLAPGRAIVPIVRATTETPVIEVLGTGFFVGIGSALHVITARHVIADNPLARDEKYAIVFREQEKIKIIATLRVLAASAFDLAACVVERSDFPDAIPLAIGRDDPALNADVFSFEYSATRIERIPAGGTHVAFEPYAHKGNIVRFFESTFPEKVRTPSILTSFPAMQGASGAPILAATSSKKSFAVLTLSPPHAGRRGSLVLVVVVVVALGAASLTSTDRSGQRARRATQGARAVPSAPRG